MQTLSKSIIEIYDNNVAFLNQQISAGSSVLSGQEFLDMVEDAQIQCNETIGENILKLIHSEEPIECDLTLQQFNTLNETLNESDNVYLHEHLQDLVNEIRVDVN